MLYTVIHAGNCFLQWCRQKIKFRVGHGKVWVLQQGIGAEPWCEGSPEAEKFLQLLKRNLASNEC